MGKNKSIDLNKLISGDRRTLAKSITLIESTREEDIEAAQQLLRDVLPHTGKSFRLGVTGSPGVGKSTFIEHFGMHLINQKHKIAILAIDPSSPTTGGSILGDKTRMEKLSQEDNAFIRPSPSSGMLGGVAQKTREAILLCEAAGYDFIIVETVGVGQSEYEVANMVDFFLLLILPSGGDELQGIKKGILELADTIIINKADGDNLKLAQQTRAQYQSGVSITASDSFWKTEVITNSSVKCEDFGTIYTLLLDYKKKALDNKFWNVKRKSQNLDWFNALIKEMVIQKINTNKKINQDYMSVQNDITDLKTTPIEAARKIVAQILK